MCSSDLHDMLRQHAPEAYAKVYNGDSFDGFLKSVHEDLLEMRWLSPMRMNDGLQGLYQKRRGRKAQ